MLPKAAVVAQVVVPASPATSEKTAEAPSASSSSTPTPRSKTSLSHSAWAAKAVRAVTVEEDTQAGQGAQEQTRGVLETNPAAQVVTAAQARVEQAGAGAPAGSPRASPPLTLPRPRPPTSSLPAAKRG